MPACVTALDGTNLQLMDAVFSLFSFAFKYLLQPLKNDIENFYGVYSELLKHKNKFIRKFAAQAFSYVLRKVPFAVTDSIPVDSNQTDVNMEADEKQLE